jgi:hypothetical protein
MEPLSKEQLLIAALQAKTESRLKLAQLPVERKLELVRQMVAVARDAGTLPAWYYRLLCLPKPEQK